VRDAHVVVQGLAAGICRSKGPTDASLNSRSGRPLASLASTRLLESAQVLHHLTLPRGCVQCTQERGCGAGCGCVNVEDRQARPRQV
jgi:hypothetical protein